MSFEDLDELIAPSKKQLPISGTIIEFPDRISAKSGTLLLRIQQRGREDPTLLADGARIVEGLIDEDGMNALIEEVLGMEIVEFMGIVGFDGDRMMHVFKTLMAWHLYGQAAAEKAWSTLGNPPAPTTKKAARPSRAKAPSARRGSTAG